MLQVGQGLQKPCEKSKVERLSCAAIIKSEDQEIHAPFCVTHSQFQLVSFNDSLVHELQKPLASADKRGTFENVVHNGREKPKKLF